MIAAIEQGQNQISAMGGQINDMGGRIIKIEEEIQKLTNQKPPQQDPHPGQRPGLFDIGSPLSEPPPTDPWSQFRQARQPAPGPQGSGMPAGSSTWSGRPDGGIPTGGQPAPGPQGSGMPAGSYTWSGRPDGGIPTGGNTTWANPGPTFGSSPHPSASPSQVPPTPSSWATAGAGTNMMPWNEKHWTVDHKPPRELRTFDGDIRFYDKWRLRIRNHFIASNMFYQNIFDLIESNREPITFQALSQTKLEILPNANWIWLANHIFGFVAKCVNDAMLGRLTTMAGGEEFNGFEVWRALHVEHRGGSVEMTCNERGFFIDFPRCDKVEDLQNHIVQWKKLQMEHGVGLPDAHLRHMFRGIIPEHVTDELKKLQSQFPVWDMEYNYVYKEISRLNDSRLSKWNMQRLTEAIKPKSSQKINHVGSEQRHVEQSQDVPPPPIPDMSSMQANLERMVAAAFSKAERGRPSAVDRGRSTAKNTSSGSRSGSVNSNSSQKPRYRSLPNPKFDGCWCCGEKGHSRAQCKEFARIRAANGGKIPRDYKGAYEKHVEKLAKSTITAAITNDFSDHDEFEHDETFVWPMLGSPPPPKTSISNKFSALSDSDTDEDESEIVKALAQLSSNVTVGPKKPQSQSRKAKSGLDMTRIHAVAKKIRDGHLTLPDIKLESNSEYECCWALVDTGAGVNVASKSQFPNAEKVQAPEVQLTTAGGSLLPNQGAMRVVTTSQEGIVRERIFYDAPVDMPIISIAEASKEGNNGSNTLFRKTDGYIEDNATHKRQHFVKRKGVYFVKLFTKKVSADNESDFGRLGHLP